MNNISEEHSVINICNIVIGCSVSVYVVFQRNLVPFSFENKILILFFPNLHPTSFVIIKHVS